MYRHTLHRQLHDMLLAERSMPSDRISAFELRLLANAAAIQDLYREIYGGVPESETCFQSLVAVLARAHRQRPDALRARDEEKLEKGGWFLDNGIAGMSLYVDRFCGGLSALSGRLDYFRELGVNLLHLMPLFESPEGESDGGYAVSDFRKVAPRFGTIDDLRALQSDMQAAGMYLMLDIVLNHTSHRHAWAVRARQGEAEYQRYYHLFDDRSLPDRYDAAMPEIFPESAPGNFTYLPECGKWVMTVFHDYQWDLNYRNPRVFVEMLDNVLFYANLGVDVLRIDAPAFIWKEPGTSCQNLPQAHTLLRLLRLCVSTAAPGMALLGEAIVAPAEIMRYFGTDGFEGQECDLAYNATHMAVQWDALATGDTRILLAAQAETGRKPFGTSWINYTRCHDDIGLGYDDRMIRSAGFDPFAHRRFIKDYYSGAYPGSAAKGALFSVNPKTQDARISGSLASLCGLERTLSEGDAKGIATSLAKIRLMQAHCFLLGGIPMIFYGDETGHLNDYGYLSDPGKAYDNRWMHRPVIDWDRNARRLEEGAIEHRVFQDTRRLLQIRRALPCVSDRGNLAWLDTGNIHVAAYLRATDDQSLYCVFNFSAEVQEVSWHAFKRHGRPAGPMTDLWSGASLEVGQDHQHLRLEPFGFMLLQPAGG